MAAMNLLVYLGNIESSKDESLLTLAPAKWFLVDGADISS